MIKQKRFVSIRQRSSERAAADIAASLFSNTMKKFFVFILILLSLIVSEYYFLTEIFTQKRIPVLVVSFVVTIVCLYCLIRYFKRSVFS